jgi:hypothetical protein
MVSGKLENQDFMKSGSCRGRSVSSQQAGTRHGRAKPVHELLIANYELPVLREKPAQTH